MTTQNDNMFEKFILICFGLNVIFIISVISFIPLIFIYPEIINNLMQLVRNYQIPFMILNSLVAIHVFYCLFFWYKYDRYSKAIIPLFFLSSFYAPFYFYQVKIKKRKLFGKITENKVDTIQDLSISEIEFNEITRNNIIETISLWSSKEKQIELVKQIKNEELLNEMQNIWNENYPPKSEVFNEIFRKKEIDMMSEFDEIISDKLTGISNKYRDNNDLINSNEFNEIREIANELLIKFDK